MASSRELGSMDLDELHAAQGAVAWKAESGRGLPGYLHHTKDADAAIGGSWLPLIPAHTTRSRGAVDQRG